MKVRERESGRIIVTFPYNPAEKYRSIPKSEGIIKKLLSIPGEVLRNYNQTVRLFGILSMEDWKTPEFKVKWMENH